MARASLRRELRRVDLSADSAGLPVSLMEAIEAEGGLWAAGDHYTEPTAIVEGAQRVGAVALRLDVRDLSFIDGLPGVRYLHLRSDGRPVLDPIAGLRDLRALIVETSAIRGELDPLAFPGLEWLRIGLGGKGGAGVMPSIQRGHAGLRWLAITETRIKRVSELVGGFPRLTHLSIWYADFLKELGDLAAATPELAVLRLGITQIASLDGLDALAELQVLDITGGKVTDLEPIGRSRGLRYARVLLPRATSIEPLVGHPALRMLELTLAGEPSSEALDAMPGLVAVGRGARFEGPIRQADLLALPSDHPLRVEWRAAMRR
jgi:hypothetical protein